MQRDTAEETALVNMTAVTITIKKNNFLQMQLCVLCMSIQENIHISLPRSLKVNGHTAVVVIFSLQEVWSSSPVIITVLLLKQRRGISDLASMCRSVHFYKRPKASKALSDLQK